MVVDLWEKSPLQHDLPHSMREIADKLAGENDQLSCLRRAYEILTDRFHGDRLKTFTYRLDLFSHDLHYLWNKKFLHCTNSNYLLRHLLIASGHFKESDIQLSWTRIWYVSPHQYVQVKVANKRTDVDIRASRYGIPFGDHSHGFH